MATTPQYIQTLESDPNGPPNTTSGGVPVTDSSTGRRLIADPTAGSMAKLPAVKSLPKRDPLADVLNGVAGPNDY